MGYGHRRNGCPPSGTSRYPRCRPRCSTWKLLAPVPLADLVPLVDIKNDHAGSGRGESGLPLPLRPYTRILT